MNIYIYIWSKTAIWSICSKRISHGVVVFSIFPRFLDDLDAMIWRVSCRWSPAMILVSEFISALRQKMFVQREVSPTQQAWKVHILALMKCISCIFSDIELCKLCLILMSKSAAFLRTYWWRQKNHFRWRFWKLRSQDISGMIPGWSPGWRWMTAIPTESLPWNPVSWGPWHPWLWRWPGLVYITHITHE